MRAAREGEGREGKGGAQCNASIFLHPHLSHLAPLLPTSAVAVATVALGSKAGATLSKLGLLGAGVATYAASTSTDRAAKPAPPSNLAPAAVGSPPAPVAAAAPRR